MCVCCYHYRRHKVVHCKILLLPKVRWCECECCCCCCCGVVVAVFLLLLLLLLLLVLLLLGTVGQGVCVYVRVCVRACQMAYTPSSWWEFVATAQIYGCIYPAPSPNSYTCHYI